MPGGYKPPRRDLETLLSLYRPNVSDGNYHGDVMARGGNHMLRKAIVRLGLATSQEVDTAFIAADKKNQELWDNRLNHEVVISYNGRSIIAKKRDMG